MDELAGAILAAFRSGDAAAEALAGGGGDPVEMAARYAKGSPEHDAFMDGFLACLARHFLRGV